MDALSQLNAGLHGRYIVEREIGVGGMATVFLARDLRHDRRVALKVLKPELVAVLGADRFLSEIQMTAKLQHPNLLPLFDSGETSGLLYYVMPYVEGETLRRRLDREKQLPVDDAVQMAAAICIALDYAHRQGIVHRDLKPENVLLHDGQPIIADFGIALAISKAGGARLTHTGISLGTPQYMSPEQATGDRTIDARADIYSVGALTYEMLGGEAPHTGTTAQAVIAKLLTETPRPLRSLRSSIPAQLDAAVHRALQKLPADRFATARDFADALTGKVPMALLREDTHARSQTMWKVATAAFAAVSVAAVAWAVTHRAAVVPTPVFQAALSLPDSVALSPSPFTRSLDLSPDGTQIVYVGVSGLFVRALNSLTPRRLTSEAASDPKFSPNGEWVAYISRSMLRKVQVRGGTPSQTIVDSVSRFGWSSQGTVVFTRSGPAAADLWRVNEKGGPVQRFVHQRRPTDKAYGTPSFFPDGETFFVPVVTDGADPDPEIAVGQLSNSEMRYLNVHGSHPLLLAGGVFAFVRGQSIMAASFDTRSLQVIGTPVEVFQGVMSKGSSAEMAVSSSGTMVYLPGFVPQQLVEIDRVGRSRPLPHDAGLFTSPRYSPDGRRVALVVAQAPSGETRRTWLDIWIYDVASPTVTQMTTSHVAGAPEWTRNGRRVGWTEVDGGLGLRATDLKRWGTFWRAADRSDTAASLDPSGLGLSFSPKGDFAVEVVVAPDRRALSVLQLDSTHRRTPIKDVDVPPSARVSPDGRWVAYMALESGQTEVYLRPLSASGSDTQISAGGGLFPVWNPAGRELFYRAGQHLIAATLSFDTGPRVVRRDTLPFKLEHAVPSAWTTYDVSADGQKFLMVKAAGDQPIVITGWLDDVRKKLSGR